MRLRFSLLMGLVMAGLVSEGRAAITDARPVASRDLDTGPIPGPSFSAFGDRGSKTFFWRLGKGYSPAEGLFLSPYLEIAALPLTGAALGAIDGGFPNPSGSFLMGGLLTYRLAPRWKASFDFAFGQPLLSNGIDGSHGLMTGEGDDLQLILRSRLRLGYVVGTNFNFVTSIDVVRLSQSSSIGMAPIGYGEVPVTSFNLGFSYRFR